MAEETSLMDKPKKMWNDAIRLVKGEDTGKLVEDFTAEMTLVAEGLCEDQNRLRGEVNRMMTEEDRRIQRQESRIQELEAMLEEQQEEHDRVVTELRSRLASLEKQSGRQENVIRREMGKKEKKHGSRLREATILIATAAVAVIAVVLVLKLV